MIPYGRQAISDQDVEAVVDVLRSDFLTQGPAVERFEREMAAYCGAHDAVAVCNATAALHLACLALGLGPGDRLWTSPNTFVASANCGLYCGADVDFVDIDPRTYNMSVPALRKKLELARAERRLPKVLVPVHFAGQACDMGEIRRLADEYGFSIVEDASHAVGGEYAGHKIGDGTWADITIFSFHPVKIITTGEGGMALTNSPELAERLRLLRSHGVTRDPAQMTGPADGQWYYQQVALGFNYRMTDLQAALGCSQLSRLDDFVERRTQLAQRYGELLADLPLTLPWQDPAAKSAWHLFVVHCQQTAERGRVFNALRAAGVGANVHYIPVHTQPHYQRLGFRQGQFPEAEHYYHGAISLPLFPLMTEADQDYVVEVLRKALAS